MSTNPFQAQEDPFAISAEEFWVLLRTITREAVLETLEQAYVDAKGVSAEAIGAELTDNMSLGEKIDRVQSLIDARDPFEKPRLSTAGERAAPIDKIMQKRVCSRIVELLGDVIFAITSEEGTEDEYGEFLNLPEGFLGAVIDPVDGTSNQRSIREAFSCNIAVYRSRGDGTFDLLGGVCTNSSMETLYFDLNPGSAFMMSPSGTTIDLTGAAFDPGKRMIGTLATVATRGPARDEISGILDPKASFYLPPAEYGGQTYYDPALTVFLTAGAPKMISWPLSELEYMYVPHDQAVYDALPMVGVLIAGNCKYYVATTGMPATLDEVIGWLSSVKSPNGADPNHHRPFKAGLLVRDGASPATTREILNKIKAAVQ
jgi:hypothetical protein